MQAAVLIILLASFPPPLVKAYDFQDCEGCHDSALKEDAAREYLHAPFKEKDCGQCHAAVIPDEATASDLKKITFLAEATQPATQHGFLLPGGKSGDVLVIDVEGTEGVLSRQEVTVPALADLAQMEDSGKAPVISGLQVLQVQQGVLLTAKVGWQTDTITDALVRYGDKDLEQTSQSGMRLGRQHQVVLNNLKADRTYHFTAVSRDLHGRSQVSESMAFSTAKPLAAVQPSVPDNQSSTGNVTGAVSQFRRLGADYLLELTHNQPFSVTVSRKGRVEEKASSEEEFHKGLSNMLVTSMKACLNCHEAHLHPLNVSPKKSDVKIPPEFPTLPTGKITCTSCHSPHSSDYYFLLRKPGEKELCISCHQQKRVR
jgi:predicted CXXCH cytochrome family protein